VCVWLGLVLEVEVGRVGWPFFVVVPGLGLLGLGLAAAGRLGEVLAMVGGVVTMAGVVLLVQNATDQFETWECASRRVLCRSPGFVGFVGGGGGDRRPPLRVGQPLRPGGPADLGWPGPA